MQLVVMGGNNALCPHDRPDAVVQHLPQRIIDGLSRFERTELNRRDGVSVEKTGRGGGCNPVRSPSPERQESADGGVACAGDEDRCVTAEISQSGIND